MVSFRTWLASAFALSLLGPAVAQADDYLLVIKNHRFEPAELRVPAGKRVKLVIHNQDATAEEFESHDLRREKIIPGNTKASVWVGPLPAGEYGFFGEFHEDTAQGKLIAK
ncbi:MAG: cupredoxin domain-containing protein [Gammaproteobacteria bacterium]